MAEQTPKISEVELFDTAILPNGEKVIYYDGTHTYIVRGKEVLSITQLLSCKFGDSYAKVNKAVLNSAAEHGTAVHAELDRLINQRLDGLPVDNYEFLETENYFKYIEPLYKIQPIMTEKVVVLYDDNNEPIAAGRFDLLCYANGVKTLADFKTTSTIHTELVTGQLNLYRRAAIQSGYLKEDENVELAVIQLRNDAFKYRKVPVLGPNYHLQYIF